MATAGTQSNFRRGVAGKAREIPAKFSAAQEIVEHQNHISGAVSGNRLSVIFKKSVRMCNPGERIPLIQVETKHTMCSILCKIRSNSPHRIVCSWCGTVKTEGDEPTSHGICDKCLEIHFPSFGGVQKLNVPTKQIGTSTNPTEGERAGCSIRWSRVSLYSVKMRRRCEWAPIKDARGYERH